MKLNVRFMVGLTRSLVSSGLLMTACLSVSASVNTTTANNGNLIMQDIPAIPTALVSDLNRYQNTRSAHFLDWTADGESIYISTRFGNVDQIHRVDQPRGARHQISFFKEPVRSVQRQVQGNGRGLALWSLL